MVIFHGEYQRKNGPYRLSKTMREIEVRGNLVVKLRRRELSEEMEIGSVLTHRTK
jgi:hypothetical protein